MGYRERIEAYVAEAARPADKYGHQPRLYALMREIAAGSEADDDVLHAAAWLHDIGVFIGHRPEDPEALARWDNVAYAVRVVPGLLREFGFPTGKIDAVIAAVAAHLPKDVPSTVEGVVLRDADILEQLGAVGILRNISKVGRDTRFAEFTPIVGVLRRNLEGLPGQLKTEAARRLAAPRIEVLRVFLEGVASESAGHLH